MTSRRNNHAFSFCDNEEDLCQIEDAVREAVTAVIAVFCKISNKRMQEYEMKVAERDKENSALRMQLETAEDELRQLRSSVEHQSVRESDSHTAGNRRFGLPLGARQRLLKRDFTSPCGLAVASGDLLTEDAVTYASDVSVTEDVDQHGHRKQVHRELTRSPRLRIKEEPLDFETVFIKWEVSEDHVRKEEDTLGKDHETHPGPATRVPLALPRGASPCVVQEVTFAQSVDSGEITSVARLQKRLANRERQKRYREKIRADPERSRAYREKDRCRYQRRKKLICELPEQSQKLKRQAWREAARRHRARKKSYIQMSQLACLQNTETVLNSAAPLRS